MHHQPPEGTNISLTSDETGMTIDVPATGLAAGFHLLAFPLGFVAFICVGVILVLFNLPAADDPEGPAKLLLMAGLTLPTLAMGIAMLIFRIDAIYTRTKFVVIGSGAEAVLACHQLRLIFGRQEKSWLAQDLSYIRLDESPLVVGQNDRPIKELHIQPRQGLIYRTLTRRDDIEIAWIAAELRAQTGTKQYVEKSKKK